MYIRSRGEFHEDGFALGGSQNGKAEQQSKARRLGRAWGSGAGRLSTAERGRVQDSAARKGSVVSRRQGRNGVKTGMEARLRGRVEGKMGAERKRRNAGKAARVGYKKKDT